MAGVNHCKQGSVGRVKCVWDFSDHVGIVAAVAETSGAEVKKPGDVRKYDGVLILFLGNIGRCCESSV